MVSSSITIQDPRDCQSHRSFSFDYAYWSHSGFVQDCSGLYVPEEPGGRYADQVSCSSVKTQEKARKTKQQVSVINL